MDVPNAIHDIKVLLFGVFFACADTVCDALPGDHRAVSRWRSCTPSWRKSWKPRRRARLRRKKPHPWTLGFTRWPSPPLPLPQPRLFEAQQNQYHWLIVNTDTSSWIFQKTGTFYIIVCCITFHECLFSLAVCQSCDSEVQLPTVFFQGACCYFSNFVLLHYDMIYSIFILGYQCLIFE